MGRVDNTNSFRTVVRSGNFGNPADVTVPFQVRPKHLSEGAYEPGFC